jgi:hypothetical protein
LLTMIQQRGSAEKVSSRNLWLPLQVRPGGEAELANMDGGDLGRDSGTTYDVAQVTTIFFPSRGGNHQAGGIRNERTGPIVTGYVVTRAAGDPLDGSQRQARTLVCSGNRFVTVSGYV